MKSVKIIVKETDTFFDMNIVDYALMSNVAKVKLKLGPKSKSQTMNFLEMYCKIKDDYDVGRFIIVDPITKKKEVDPLFKHVYQNFYKMTKLQVPSGFIDEYFEILKDSKTWESGWDWRKKYYDIAKRLEPYSKGNFQLSFISKLLHTVDNTFPIYDKNVRKVLGLPRNTGSTYSGKEANGETILEQLKEKYADLQIDRDFNILVNKVTCFSGVGIAFEKKCDFIFWVMGDFVLKVEKTVKKVSKSVSVKGSAASESAGAFVRTSGNSPGEAD